MKEKLSDIMEDVLGPLTEKRGYVESQLISNWGKVLGGRWSQGVILQRVTFTGGKNSAGVVHLRVDPRYAMELQHESLRFIEKINIFLGYNAISELRIVQDQQLQREILEKAPKEKVKKDFAVVHDPSIIAQERRMIADIEDDLMQEKLNKLLDSLSEK